MVASVIKASYRFETAWNRLPLFVRLDEFGAVMVNYSVAVENDNFHTASLEISATRFIAIRKSASNANRFLLSSTSSTITMTESKKASTGAFKMAKLLR